MYQERTLRRSSERRKKQIEREQDPFYSESNMKHLRESIEQSKRGETEFFDVDEYIRQHPLD